MHSSPKDNSHPAQSTRSDQGLGELLFSMSGVTLRVRDSWILPDTNWEVRTGENWAVIGPNGAGKTTLMRAIIGQVPAVAGKIKRPHPMASPDAIGYVSFEFEQRFVDLERARDEARYFSGSTLEIRRAGDIVFQTPPGSDKRVWKMNASIDALDIRHLLDREVRLLSSGELRRVFIARALLKSTFNPMLTSGGLLVLDEPFASLDDHHRHVLATALNVLMDQGIQVILVSHRIDEIPKKITRIIALKDCRIFGQGLRKEVLSPQLINRLYETRTDKAQSTFEKTESSKLSPHPIIEVRRATVRYGEIIVFKNLSWLVNRGENWAISGPTVRVKPPYFVL